jgi:hypothetical protein
MRLALLVGAMVAIASVADARDTWLEWKHLSAIRCPSHHVDWMCGDCQLSVIEAFDATLNDRQRRQVAQVADIKTRCTQEVMGFGCEFASNLDAYAKLGLMKRFVRFGCSAVKCEEAALCSRMPPGP